MIVKQNITNPKSFLYLRDQLSLGKSLSNTLGMLPIEKGTVFAFVPAGVSEEQLFNFKIGGIYPPDTALGNKEMITPIKNDSRPLVINEILLHLNSNVNNCCLFEDALTIPTDPWVATSQIEYITVSGSEMLYFFDSSFKDEEKIGEVFSISEGYVFLCALSSLAPVDRNKVLAYKDVSSELLKVFMTNLSAFFVRAYDGEGYLMWVTG